MLLRIHPITIAQNLVTATNKMITSAKNLQTSEATGWNSQDKMAPRLRSFQTQQQENRAANCGRKISFIRIPGRNLHSHDEEKTARLTLPQEAIEKTKGKTEQTKKTHTHTHTHCYEQKWQSHTCSGTINSSMYDSDFTTTTSLLTLSAPSSGQRP